MTTYNEDTEVGITMQPIYPPSYLVSLKRASEMTGVPMEQIMEDLKRQKRFETRMFVVMAIERS
jgi:hypothetical protein